MSEQIDNDRWEELCRRCGGCCFEKQLDDKGNVQTLAIPCRFLDIHTRTCRIYHQRLQAEEDCIKLTPENVIELDWLPEDCAYRQQLNETPLDTLKAKT